MLEAFRKRDLEDIQVKVQRDLEDQYKNGDMVLLRPPKHTSTKASDNRRGVLSDKISPQSMLQSRYLPRTGKDSKVRKTNSMIKFYKEREDFLHEDARYKSYLKKQLMGFRSTVQTKADSFNIKVP